jgi:hypothetical protein
MQDHTRSHSWERPKSIQWQPPDKDLSTYVVDL